MFSVDRTKTGGMGVEVAVQLKIVFRISTNVVKQEIIPLGIVYD